jgi:hypothetical protein
MRVAKNVGSSHPNATPNTNILRDFQIYRRIPTLSANADHEILLASEENARRPCVAALLLYQSVRLSSSMVSTYGAAARAAYIFLDASEKAEVWNGH